MVFALVEQANNKLETKVEHTADEEHEQGARPNSVIVNLH